MIDYVVLEKLIGDISGMGNKVVRLSGGGEPLLCKGIGKIIQLIDEMEMKSYIISNASFLDNKLEDIIAEHTSVFRVSLNAGNQRDYLKIHGVDHFNKVISNMKKLSSLRLRKGRCESLMLGASFVVTQDNFKSLSQTARITKECGFDFFFARTKNPIRPKFVGENQDILNAEVEKCQALRDEKFNFSGRIEALDGSTSKKKPGTMPCFATHFRTYVDVKGYVYPCYSGIVHQHSSVGNINEKTIIEILRSEKFLLIRERLEGGELFDFCNKFCTYAKFNMFVNTVSEKTKMNEFVRFCKVPQKWSSSSFSDQDLRWF